MLLTSWIKLSLLMLCGGTVFGKVMYGSGLFPAGLAAGFVTLGLRLCTPLPISAIEGRSKSMKGSSRMVWFVPVGGQSARWTDTTLDESLHCGHGV